jgi:hypothetical protein
MLQYLDWLREQLPPEPRCLLLDQYGTHTTEQMNRKAEALGIEFIFVPKGATKRYQPPDKRIFGSLKSNGREKWRYELAQHHGKSWTREVGAELLLQSWNELSNSVVTVCWDSGEKISDDEDSENSDENFELQMATGIDTDTDDDYITMFQAEIWDEKEEAREDGRAWLSTVFVPVQ